MPDWAFGPDPRRWEGIGVHFELLGALRVHTGEHAIRVGGPRECRLLAALLLNADRTLPINRLGAVLWAGEPPATAKAQVHNSVAALRRALGEQPSPVIRHGSGFMIRLAGHELDVTAFREQVAEADRLPDPAAAAERLRAALQLWRGPALDGIAEGILAAAARQLDEERLRCLERRIALDLVVGRHAEVVGELAALCEVHPLRERLVELRMTALYRTARRRDALEVYAEARRRLAAETGRDPRPELQTLHQAILRSDTELSPPPAAAAPRPVPAQLPADVPDFTGRTAELDRLDALRSERVVVLTGSGGIGKTALAVHWAGRSRGRFPDGILYVDLRGYSPAPPLRPVDALARFLHALGVPDGEVPVDGDAAAASYRTLLADRQLLVVLDNAADAEQVRPLLPGGAACLAVVTSRDGLADLPGPAARDGARRIELDVLPRPDAQRLLAGIIGPDRTAAEPGPAAALVEACARLPLTVRVTAAQLVEAPDSRVADHLSRLEGGDRLSASQIDDDPQAAVRAVFDLSYVAIRPDARRLFRLLGLLPGPDVTPAAAGALADLPARRVGALLGRLAAAHLLDRRGAARFSFHDLLRRYAADRAERDEEPAARAAALERLGAAYLGMIAAAADRLYPEKVRLPLPDGLPQFAMASHGEALAWLDSERRNLTAYVLHAAEYGPRDLAIRVADALHGYFWIRAGLLDGLAVGGAQLAAARAEGDQCGAASAQLGLALIDMRRGRQREAIERFSDALSRSRTVGWEAGQAAALTNLGAVYFQTGRPARAVEFIRQAVRSCERLGRRPATATNLTNLGVMSLSMGSLARATEYAERGLAIQRSLDGPAGVALSGTILGQIHTYLGRFDRAEDELARALQVVRETGDRACEVTVLASMALLASERGREDAAIGLARQALGLAGDTGDARLEAACHNAMGRALCRQGQHSAAIDEHDRAAALVGRGSEPQTTALVGTAEALRRQADAAGAAARATEAAALCRDAGYRLVEVDANLVLAAAELDRGHDAGPPAQRAVALCRHTGYRLGLARALILRGRAHSGAGAQAQAARDRQEAGAIIADLGLPDGVPEEVGPGGVGLVTGHHTGRAAVASAQGASTASPSGHDGA